jgi:hypothetical protein
MRWGAGIGAAEPPATSVFAVPAPPPADGKGYEEQQQKSQFSYPLHRSTFAHTAAQASRCYVVLVPTRTLGERDGL